MRFHWFKAIIVAISILMLFWAVIKLNIVGAEILDCVTHSEVLKFRFWTGSWSGSWSFFDWQNIAEASMEFVHLTIVGNFRLTMTTREIFWASVDIEAIRFMSKKWLTLERIQLSSTVHTLSLWRRNWMGQSVQHLWRR